MNLTKKLNYKEKIQLNYLRRFFFFKYFNLCKNYKNKNKKIIHYSFYRKLLFKRKNRFFFRDIYYLKKKNNIFIKVLSTTRNIIIGVFVGPNKLQFILSMGFIKNQNNLKRNSFFAGKMLINALLLKNLFAKELFKARYNYILIFLSSGRFYRILYKMFKMQKLDLRLIIQKNNFVHNGCFKKKQKRR